MNNNLTKESQEKLFFIQKHDLNSIFQGWRQNKIIQCLRKAGLGGVKEKYNEMCIAGGVIKTFHDMYATLYYNLLMKDAGNRIGINVALCVVKDFI